MKSSRWLEHLDRPTILWLACVPQWTVDLAADAGFPFPSEAKSLNGMVEGLAAAGLATTRTEPTGDAVRQTFWINDATRQSWLSKMDRDQPDVMPTVREIVSALQRCTVAVPAPTRSWLELIDPSADISGPRLVNRIRTLVDGDHLAEATNDVEAGAVMAPLMGVAYTQSLDRARRLIHLGYRRRRDSRSLGAFVRRAEQIDPIRALLTDDRPDRWALHLLGPGGVGKTMLVRYLTSGLLAADSAPGVRKIPPFALARIDFDYISADYPVRRPLQLLTKLADELILNADTYQRERALGHFAARAESVNAAEHPLKFDDVRVQKAIGTFAEFLQTLPGPQLLVLDTCEELAKLQVRPGAVPAIEMTFALMEGVHALCPTLRVVFAGRRYLAGAGAGWTAPASPEEKSLAGPAPRDYLRLTRLRGFSTDEARQLVEAVDVDSGTAPPAELSSAILARSLEVGSQGFAAQPDRYNPFMIGLYRDWWEDDRSMTAATINESGPEVYIQGRIVDRLERPLQALVPALVRLGRFDETMVEDLLAKPVREGVLDEVIDTLAEQEWMDVTVDDESHLRVLTISDGLLPFLRAWADTDEHRAESAVAQARLADPLRSRLRTAPLSRVTPELILATLRSYPTGRTAKAWGRLEQRIEIENRWDWASSILDRVMAELEPAFRADPLLAAAVRSSALSAQSRQAPTADLSDQWSGIVDLLETRAARETAATTEMWWPRRQMRLRAQLAQLRVATPAQVLPESVLGLLGRDRLDGEPTVGRVLVELLGRRELPLPSVVGTLEAVLADVPTADRIGAGGVTVPEIENAADAVEARLDDADSPLVAAALVALSTLAPAARSAEFLDRAATILDGARPIAFADRPLFDRRRPELWVALHRSVDALGDGPLPSTTVIEGWADLVEHGRDGVDGNRLLGACGELLARHGRDVAVLLESWHDRNPYEPAELVSNRVHDAAPPLFVAAARAWLRAGRPLAAERILDRRRQVALDSRSEDATLRMADQMLMWLAVRMRWADYRPSIATSMSAGPDPWSVYLIGTLRTLTAPLAAQNPTVDPASAPPWVGTEIELERRLVLGEDVFGAAADRVTALQIHDPISASQLATAAALADRRRSGHPDEKQVDLVRGLYKTFAGSAGLPPWETLAQRADDGESSSRETWGRWLDRWAFLGGHRDSGHRDSASRPAVQELTDVVRQVKTPKVVKEATPGRRRVRNTLLWTCVTAVVLAGFYFFGTAVGLTAAVESFGVPSGVLTVVTGTVTTVLVVALVILLVSVSVNPVRRHTPMAVTMGKTGTGLVARLADPLNPLREFGSGSQAAVEGDRVVGEPFHLGYLSARVYRVIRLSTRMSEQPIHWEGMLTDPDAPSAWKPVWVRQVSTRGRAVCPAASTYVQVPDPWEAKIRRAYGSTVKASPESSPALQPVRHRLMHYLGTPVETSAGIILRLSDAADPGTGRTRSFNAVATLAAGAGWLTVLQDIPSDTELEVDPSSAALMLRLAVDLQREVTSLDPGRAGSWLVVIPSVPEAVAQDMWVRLAEMSRAPARVSRFDLVACVGDLKSLLIAEGDRQHRSREAREIAQQILLLGPWRRSSAAALPHGAGPEAEPPAYA